MLHLPVPDDADLGTRPRSRLPIVRYHYPRYLGTTS